MSYTPIPESKRFSYISKAEKEVLLQKKMKQGLTKYEAEAQMRKENAFIISNNIKKKEEDATYKEEHKNEIFKDKFKEMIIAENEKARRMSQPHAPQYYGL